MGLANYNLSIETTPRNKNCVVIHDEASICRQSRRLSIKTSLYSENVFIIDMLYLIQVNFDMASKLSYLISLSKLPSVIIVRSLHCLKVIFPHVQLFGSYNM